MPGPAPLLDDDHEIGALGRLLDGPCVNLRSPGEHAKQLLDREEEGRESKYYPRGDVRIYYEA